jgi:hypothetical protein
MKPLPSSKVKLTLVEYGVSGKLRLNSLLREPDSAGGDGKKDKTGIITLHGSEGNAMSGINLWLAPYLATPGEAVGSTVDSRILLCMWVAILVIALT